MKTSLQRAHKWVWILIPLLIGIAVAIKTINTGFPNSDTYFIIDAGKYIVENGTVPTTNPFVIHEGFGVIIQQWLFDVLMYGVYRIGGWTGVFVYSIIILGIAAVAMYRFFGLYSQNKTLKVILLSICIAVGSAFAVARPTSLSFLMCLSVVAVMETYRRNNKWHVLLWLPLISLLTINIHAAMWPMLFVLIMPFIFPGKMPDFKSDGIGKGIAAFFKEWFTKWKWVLLAMICMVIVGFVNPNGLNGIGYLVLSYGSATNGRIAELEPPMMLSYYGMWVLLSFALLVLYVYTRKRNMDMTNFYMAAGTLVMAMLHMRNLWFLFFGATPLFLTMLDGVQRKKHKERRVTAVSLIADFYGVCLVVALAFIFCGTISVDIEDDILSPVKAVEYLDSHNKEDIVLYTGFNNGAYMEMNGYKVYMDARPELFQKKINGKEDIYSEYLNVINGLCDYEAFFDKYEFTHMIVEDGTVLSGFLRAYDGYREVVIGNGYVLYEYAGYIADLNPE